MKLESDRWYKLETHIHFSKDVDIDYDEVFLAVLNAVYDKIGVVMYLDSSSLTYKKRWWQRR